jgi:hypothetical protein
MAYSEGVERLFRDKELAMKVIGKYTKTTDRDAQDAAYGFATTFVERLPRLPYKAVETILAQIAEKDPRAKAHKPDDFIDSTFYNELEKNGFFKNATRSARSCVTQRSITAGGIEGCHQGSLHCPRLSGSTPERHRNMSIKVNGSRA